MEIRKRWPRATLIIAGPDRLTRRLRQRYPALLDVGLTSASASAVTTALKAL